MWHQLHINRTLLKLQQELVHDSDILINFQVYDRHHISNTSCGLEIRNSMAITLPRF